MEQYTQNVFLLPGKVFRVVPGPIQQAPSVPERLQSWLLQEIAYHF